MSKSAVAGGGKTIDVFPRPQRHDSTGNAQPLNFLTSAKVTSGSGRVV